MMEVGGRHCQLWREGVFLCFVIIFWKNPVRIIIIVEIEMIEDVIHNMLMIIELLIVCCGVK